MVALWPRLICSYRWHHNIMVLLWHVTPPMTLATTGPMMQSLSALLVSVPKRSDYECTSSLMTRTNQPPCKVSSIEEFLVYQIYWANLGISALASIWAYKTVLKPDPLDQTNKQHNKLGFIYLDKTSKFRIF